tara:strand:+ start:8835 stop:9605 length:771 start_codon:yes stop_codon:yes gene_type:complete
MEYSFDINYAQLYGINEAIMIKNFQYWITKNKSNDGNFHDGKTWTYNSVNAFTALFPFWSYQKICRILKSLITQKVLMVGNYNRAKYDRTKWYAFVCEETFIKIDTSSNQNSNLQDSKMKDATIKSDTPIPNGKQQIQTQIENQLYKKIIAIYNGFCLENWDAPAKINGIEGKATKEIIKYLRTICKVKNLEADVDVENAFKYILNNWSNLDTFLQKQIKLAQINSNLPNIINQLKNGAEKPNSNSIANEILAKYK